MVTGVLEVRDLTKRYGANLAVDGLSFKAEPGRVLGFLGPNGAGKTTTLRMLLGLTLPTSGDAVVDLVPYRMLSDPIKVVGAVLEGPQFHPGRSGRNHLRVLATAAGLPSSRVEEVLRLVELGYRNPDIATRLSISEATVQFHLRQLFAKLRASSRTELVHLARQQGWLE